MSLINDIRAAGSYSAALDLTVAHFQADSGTIHMLESDGVLHLKAASKSLPEPVLNLVRLVPVGKGMAGLAVERAEPVSACNIQTDSSGSVQPGAKATGIEGALVVPIFQGAKVVGALGIGNRAARTFTEGETSLLLEAGRTIAASLLS
jgi:signal transduction protein with GAF and PtsI domain